MWRWSLEVMGRAAYFSIKLFRLCLPNKKGSYTATVNYFLSLILVFILHLITATHSNTQNKKTSPHLLEGKFLSFIFRTSAQHRYDGAVEAPFFTKRLHVWICVDELWRGPAQCTHLNCPLAFQAVQMPLKRAGIKWLLIKQRGWQGNRFVDCLKVTPHGLQLLKCKCMTQIPHNTKGWKWLRESQRTAKALF